MIELPDPDKAFEFENDFYLTCDVTRISKFVAHYELFKMALEVPGAVVECGVFKGASLLRFAGFRDLFGVSESKKIIGFDTFGEFPETSYADDKPYRDSFVGRAGSQSISTEQLYQVLKRKGTDRFVELVAGDIGETVPRYVKDNPELRIALLNLDTDMLEPAQIILEHLYPRIVTGGVLIVDNYATFPGETKAIDDYFKGQAVVIKKFPFAMTPCYVVKTSA